MVGHVVHVLQYTWKRDVDQITVIGSNVYLTDYKYFEIEDKINSNNASESINKQSLLYDYVLDYLFQDILIPQI